MKLDELNYGESATIVKIGDIGKLKQRLIDMGVVTGETITLKRDAPLGDPKQYTIKGNNNIAIRKKDAQNITIKPLINDN